METERRNPPVHTFRLGPVKAAIWSNRSQNRDGTYYSLTLTRRYTDPQGGWRDTSSFNAQHIPLLMKVLEHAYDYLHELRRQATNGDEYGDAGPTGPAPAGIPDDDRDADRVA